MTYISPKPVSLQALARLNNAAASRNGGTLFVRRSSCSSGACLQFVWLNCNNSKDCEGAVLRMYHNLRFSEQPKNDVAEKYEKVAPFSQINNQQLISSSKTHNNSSF